MATVAVLGTGIMGAPIARRLAGAGHDVRAWNRTLERVEPLSDAGVAISRQPSEAVLQADAAITMLADADAVEQVIEGQAVLEALPQGALWLQMGTIGAAATDGFARRARERGTVFVDAPVLGSKAQAESGQLFVLASGPDEARERCAPLFEPLARRVEWLGAAGAGSRFKLAFNNWILCTVENLAETLAFAEALGADPRTFLSLLEGEPFDMAYAHVKGELMARREFPAAFPLRLARKDLALVLAESPLPLPLVEAALARYDRALELGHGDEDAAAVALALGPA